MKNYYSCLIWLIGLWLLNGPGAQAQNLALGRVGASSSSEGRAMANLAFDGADTTRWGSSTADNQWVSVDLGRRASISRVNLVWEAAFGKDFRLDVSDDAIRWATMATVCNNTLRANELTGLSGAGRYVRMYGLKRGTAGGFSLREFQVYGSYLPQRLVAAPTNFKVSPAGTAVALAWTSCSERGNLGFEVQRSADGRAFLGLAWVEGAGASRMAHTYAYRDVAPLRAGGYYRLVQYDADGRVTYSRVQAVLPAAPEAFTAFPNPATDQLTVAWPGLPDARAARLCLTDAQGQLVHTEPLASVSSLVLDLRPYAAGMYYLTVLADEQVLGRTRVQITR